MSGWISLLDRQPPKSGVYPACSAHPLRTYDYENWVDLLHHYNAEAEAGICKWQHGSGFYDNCITHWMEFPEGAKL